MLISLSYFMFLNLITIVIFSALYCYKFVVIFNNISLNIIMLCVLYYISLIVLRSY